MKIWVITVLMLFLVCLTVPLVTADTKTIINTDGKIKKGTVVPVEYTNPDILFPVKKLVGVETTATFEVRINGKVAAIIPEDSPLMGMEVTQECLNQHPYGSLYWYQCEGGI